MRRLVMTVVCALERCHRHYRKWFSGRGRDRPKSGRLCSERVAKAAHSAVEFSLGDTHSWQVVYRAKLEFSGE